MQTYIKKITYFCNLLLNLSLFVLSYIIPKNNNLYLFGAGRGTLFKGNPKYLYLYLLKNEYPYQISWITKNRSVYDRLNEKSYPVLKMYSIMGFWKILKAKYLIIEMSARDVYFIGYIAGNFNFIQTWHGTPLKKIWYHLMKDGKGIGKKEKFLKIILGKLLKNLK